MTNDNRDDTTGPNDDTVVWDASRPTGGNTVPPASFQEPYPLHIDTTLYTPCGPDCQQVLSSRPTVYDLLAAECEKVKTLCAAIAALDEAVRTSLLVSAISAGSVVNQTLVLVALAKRYAAPIQGQ